MERIGHISRKHSPVNLVDFTIYTPQGPVIEKVLIDPGASTSLCDRGHTAYHGLPLTPSSPYTALGIGGAHLGTLDSELVNQKIGFGKHVEPWSFGVTDMGPQFKWLLGNDWCMFHKLKLDYSNGGKPEFISPECLLHTEENMTDNNTRIYAIMCREYLDNKIDNSTEEIYSTDKEELLIEEFDWDDDSNFSAQFSLDSDDEPLSSTEEISVVNTTGNNNK